MSDMDDEETEATRKFYSKVYYNNDIKIINEFKRWIERSYQDIINNETIELYSMIYNLTEEEKNILRRRFL